MHYFVLNNLFMTVVHCSPGKLFALLDFSNRRKNLISQYLALSIRKKTWIVNSFCIKLPRVRVVILNVLIYILNNKCKLNNTTFIVTWHPHDFRYHLMKKICPNLNIKKIFVSKKIFEIQNRRLCTKI